MIKVASIPIPVRPDLGLVKKECKMDQQLMILSLTAVTAFGAVWAAFGAWGSALATRRATEAQLCSSMFDKYVDDKMRNALALLAELKRERGADLAEQWLVARSGGESWAVEADLARRHVTGYFVNLAQLYEGNLITKRLVKTAGCLQAGLTIFYEICEPLERALNPRGYGKQYFDILRKVCTDP